MSENRSREIVKKLYGNFDVRRRMISNHNVKHEETSSLPLAKSGKLHHDRKINLNNVWLKGENFALGF